MICQDIYLLEIENKVCEISLFNHNQVAYCLCILYVVDKICASIRVAQKCYSHFEGVKNSQQQVERIKKR